MILGVALRCRIHVHDVGVLSLVHCVDGVKRSFRHRFADVSMLDWPIIALLSRVIVHWLGCWKTK